MSMTKTMVGNIEVWTGDGYVDLRQPGEPENDHDLISIPVEYMPAVALALLGGITDELVERCAMAYHAREEPDEDWRMLSEAWRAVYREDVTLVLEAAFGAASGGGGEHANRRG